MANIIIYVGLLGKVRERERERERERWRQREMKWEGDSMRERSRIERMVLRPFHRNSYFSL